MLRHEGVRWAVTLRLWSLMILGQLSCGCATAGSVWIHERWDDANADAWDEDEPPPLPALTQGQLRTGSPRAVTRLGAPARPSPVGPGSPDQGGSGEWLVQEDGSIRAVDGRGRSLGRFRNTYYDFPSESDFTGKPVTLYDAQCKPITNVVRGFFESLCVQGSGLLSGGRPVSFARRDCECAEICPRTAQRICFEALELSRFPWGRGASGEPITPLLTVAVDTEVVALGTALYVPEYDGLPRDRSRASFHDGCFVAQDRGLKVKGKHVDVFTGLRSTTLLWNDLVPSNSGVTVVVDHPRCARASSARSR